MAAGWVDVRDFRRPEDPDDTAALLAALGALPAGGVVFFPAGRYVIRWPEEPTPVEASNVVLRGADRWSTTLTAKGSQFILAAPSLQGSHLAIEDLSFEPWDGPQFIACVAFSSALPGLRISRCRFLNLRTYGILGQDATDVIIEDCSFETLDPPAGNAIEVIRGVENLLIDRCVFRYCKDGIIIGNTDGREPATSLLASRVTVRNCAFEGGWWTLPARARPGGGVYAGSTASGEVILTDNALTDRSASFPRIGDFSTVRLLFEVENGTVTEGAQTHFRDGSRTSLDSLTFSPAALVRTEGPGTEASRFAVVSAMESDTTVRVEEWLDDRTRQPTPPPPAGAFYRLFRVFLGRRAIPENTGTTIFVERWHDLDGVTQPAAGLPRPLLYEVLPDHPNYLLHVEGHTRDVRVLDNVFRRGWSDQCSISGERLLIRGNDIQDGQDMGITANGGQAIITDNVVRHQGAGGIFTTNRESVIANNVLSRNKWVNAVEEGYAADIIAGGGPLISGNLCDGESAPRSKYGIALGSAVDPVVVNNKCRRHDKAPGGAGIYCFGAPTAVPPAPPPLRAKIWNNDLGEEPLAIKHEQAPGGDYQLVGNGDPNALGILAAPGSTYRRTDGPPFFYVREGEGWVGR